MQGQREGGEELGRGRMKTLSEQRQKSNSLKSAEVTRKPRISRQCECCKGIFYILENILKYNSARFCSNRCRYKTMRGSKGAASIPRPDMQGERNPNWKGGTCSRREEFRYDSRVFVWRRDVKARDGHKCKNCGSFTRIVAHHIIPWAVSESTRFNIDNGICLCRKCHLFVHSYNNKAKFYLAVPYNLGGVT